MRRVRTQRCKLLQPRGPVQSLTGASRMRSMNVSVLGARHCRYFAATRARSVTARVAPLCPVLAHHDTLRQHQIDFQARMIVLKPNFAVVQPRHGRDKAQAKPGAGLGPAFFQPDKPLQHPLRGRWPKCQGR